MQSDGAKSRRYAGTQTVEEGAQALPQGLTEHDHPCHDRTVIVTACGRIGRRRINLGHVFAGRKAGIREVVSRTSSGWCPSCTTIQGSSTKRQDGSNARTAIGGQGVTHVSGMDIPLDWSG